MEKEKKFNDLYGKLVAGEYLSSDEWNFVQNILWQDYVKAEQYLDSLHKKEN